MIVYATRILESNNYWNRVHKDFRPLCQNTAFYKTLNQAESEINPLHISWQKRSTLSDVKIEIVQLEIKEVKCYEYQN